MCIKTEYETNQPFTSIYKNPVMTTRSLSPFLMNTLSNKKARIFTNFIKENKEAGDKTKFILNTIKDKPLYYSKTPSSLGKKSDPSIYSNYNRIFFPYGLYNINHPEYIFLNINENYLNYKNISLIKKCGHGDVWECIDLNTKVSYFQHTFIKHSKMDLKKIRDSIQCNFQKYSNIFSFYFPKFNSVFEEDNSINIRFEKNVGKNLLEYLTFESFSEADVSKLAKSLIRVVDLAYKKKLKIPFIRLDTIYFSRNNGEIIAYIQDNFHFFLEDYAENYKDRFIDLIHNSPRYLLNSTRNLESDLWAIGIILLILLTGTIPFKLEESDKLKSNIMKIGKIDLNDIIWNSYSNYCIDFVQTLLNPQAKIYIECIIGNPWLSEKLSDNPISTDIILKKRKLQSLLLFQNHILDYIDYNIILKEQIKRIKAQYIDRHPQEFILFLERNKNSIGIKKKYIKKLCSEIQGDLSIEKLLFKLILTLNYPFESKIKELFYNLPYIKNEKIPSKFFSSILNIENKTFQQDFVSFELENYFFNEISYDEFFNLLIKSNRAKSATLI